MNHPACRRRTKVIVGASAAVASLTTGLAFASPALAKPTSPAPVPKTSASFIQSQHLLTVVGDAGDNSISVGRDVAGVITINGADVVINGVTVTVANVNKIVIQGGSGSDRLAIDDSNGTMPKATILGQSGDDELFGGSASDTLVGGTGNDRIIGGNGNDTLLGGVGNDTLIGGNGNDHLIGGPGQDMLDGGAGSNVLIQ